VRLWDKRSWDGVAELWGWVRVWLQLQSMLLPINLAYDGGCCHGGDYHGVKKETFLQGAMVQ